MTRSKPGNRDGSENYALNANIFSSNKIILIMKWNDLKYNNHKIVKTNLIICERSIGYFLVSKSFLENILEINL